MQERAQRTEAERARAERTIEILIESGAFRVESTVLSSGLESPMKIEADLLRANPPLHSEVCKLLAEAIRESGAKPEVVVGVVTGGAFLAREVAPMVGATFAARSGNTRTPEKLAMVSGQVLIGNRVVIIEDVITTGGNVFSLHEGLVGVDTQLVLSIFDYDFDVSKEGFSERNLPYKSLAKFSDLIGELEMRQALGRLEFYGALPMLKQWHSFKAPAKLRELRVCGTI